MPRSRAITSAILFSKPSDLLLENGRLSGSPHTRSTAGASAAATGHASRAATTAAPRTAHARLHHDVMSGVFTSSLPTVSLHPAAATGAGDGAGTGETRGVSRRRTPD